MLLRPQRSKRFSGTSYFPGSDGKEDETGKAKEEAYELDSESSSDDDDEDLEEEPKPAKKRVAKKPAAAKQAKKSKSLTSLSRPASKNRKASKQGTASSDTAPKPAPKKPPGRSKILPPGAVPNQHPVTLAPQPPLLPTESISSIHGWWNDSAIATWTKYATPAMKDLFKQDMLMGLLKNASVAAADFAVHVRNNKRWIKFGNGRTLTSNNANSLGNIFRNRQDWPSLEPMLSTIDFYSNKSGRATRPHIWLQFKLILEKNATNTHAKHRDQLYIAEKLTRHYFAEKYRIRIAVPFTPPTGIHKSKTKETQLAVEGKDVLTIQCGLFTFIIIGSRTNGKDPFFGNETEDETVDFDSFLGRAFAEAQQQDDGDNDDDKSGIYMKHGIYFNSGGVSIMFDFTVEEGKLLEFFDKISNCYNEYKPWNEPNSVLFKCPVATKSHREPKLEEKRIEAAKMFEDGPLQLFLAFQQERGHCTIANEALCTNGVPINQDLLVFAYKIRQRHSGKSLNPHIKKLLDDMGFVFDTNIWMAERTVEMMEVYSQTHGNINMISSAYTVNGYVLRQMVMHWKRNGAPQWMETLALKKRLADIGFDITLNKFQSRFADFCHRLKEWNLTTNRAKL